MKDNCYDLYLHISAARATPSRYALIDQAELKLQSGISLNDALAALRKQDEKSVKNSGNTWRPRSNVSRVEKRLPPRH